MTEQGELIALSVSPHRSQTTRDRLSAAGRLIPAPSPPGDSGNLGRCRSAPASRPTRNCSSRARGTAVIYLDSSALMKLVRQEDETAALREWLSVRPEQPLVTSELGRVEVLRAARAGRRSRADGGSCGRRRPRLGPSRPRRTRPRLRHRRSTTAHRRRAAAGFSGTAQRGADCIHRLRSPARGRGSGRRPGRRHTRRAPAAIEELNEGLRVGDAAPVGEESPLCPRRR